MSGLAECAWCEAWITGEEPLPEDAPWTPLHLCKADTLRDDIELYSDNRHADHLARWWRLWAKVLIAEELGLTLEEADKQVSARLGEAGGS